MYALNGQLPQPIINLIPFPYSSRPSQSTRTKNIETPIFFQNLVPDEIEPYYARLHEQHESADGKFNGIFNKFAVSL